MNNNYCEIFTYVLSIKLKQNKIELINAYVAFR